MKLIRFHERDRNGYLAWRDILQELEPRERGRGLALLVGLVSEENWPKDQSEYLDQVRAWDQLVRNYEDATGKTVADDLKVAVVLRHAPGDVGRHLRMQASRDMTYPELMSKLREFYVATRPWTLRSALGQGGSSAPPSSSAPVPMDIDQITASVVAALHKGKGKDGKGKKGKDGKGKGGGDQSKGQGRGNKGKEGKGDPKKGPKGGCFNCGGAYYA